MSGNSPILKGRSPQWNVDQAPGEREEPMRQSLPPERVATLQSGYERLQRAGLKTTRHLVTALALTGCTAKGELGRRIQVQSPPLVAQRVTAAVQREALRLVRLETEHEAFFTTPEHPFATPNSSWLSAGRLAPGDWVVSERFGALRLLSARSEPSARPVPVFNLTVAPSHAYFVGTGRVLVHNTQCKLNPSDVRREAVERLIREREAINRQINALKKATPASAAIAELRLKRDRVSQEISKLRRTQKRNREIASSTRHQRSWQFYAADHESTRKSLGEAQAELADLERRLPSSTAEQRELEARKAELNRQITSLQLIYERTGRILAWLRELVELEKAEPTTEADRQALKKREEELRANLKVERDRAAVMKGMRRKRAGPEGREERIQYDRALLRRQRRTASYLADAERPPDRLERLEGELADWRKEASSESRDARIDHLTAQVDTLKRLVEVRRAEHRVKENRRWSQRMSDKHRAQGKDTSKFDKKVEQAVLKLHALRVERASLRVRDHLLARLDRTPWARAPETVNETQLLEFERQLATGLEDEQALVDIERALTAMDPLQANLLETTLDEAQDVENVQNERRELQRQPPSPERTAELQASYERLQQELEEEHAAVEFATSALANEQVLLNREPTWRQRLQAVQEEQVQIHAQWHANLQARLHSARGQLELMQHIERFRDEAIEAELAREIALLEDALRNSD